MNIYEFSKPPRPDKCPSCGQHPIIELKLYADEFWLCDMCAKRQANNLAVYANKRNYDAFRQTVEDAQLGYHIRSALTILKIS